LRQISPAGDNGADIFTDTMKVDRKPEGGGGVDPRGTDVLFTMVPVHGDFRLLAAKKEVPASDWMLHPLANRLGQKESLNGDDTLMMAHSLARYNTQAESGFARDASPFTNRLVSGANYSGGKIPDLPPMPATATDAARRFGDFDNAVGDMRDGPWINKPDEGNATLIFRLVNDNVTRWVNAYLGGRDEYIAGDPGETMMTPNRMVSSPVMFGSLPSGVNRGQPWQTLLFRPWTKPPNSLAANHPGAPSYFAGQNPADHYLLDLFTMPVVEPYAITENFSTAGKINMNYQIVPFGRSRSKATDVGTPTSTVAYIRRATGLHALMKGEVLTAVPLADAARYKGYPSGNLQIKDNYNYRQPWTDTSISASYGGKKLWHRKIEVERRAAAGVVQGTLEQFEDRFNFKTTVWSPGGAQGLFRTPSQICEIHLIPRKLSGTNTDGGDTGSVPYKASDMATFWGAAATSANPQGRALTGDNLKERPYSNLYARLTTQSNTFRVYFRAQLIRKARSAAANVFDLSKDGIASDYRGSALVERKLDLSSVGTAMPDYGASTTPTTVTSLDNFYRMRVLEMKRFVP